MRVPQTGSEVMQLLSAAERGESRVKVDEHGDVVVIGALGRFADWVRGRYHGEAWRAQRDADRNREVMEAFATALSREFQPAEGDVRKAKIYKRVVEDLSGIVEQNYARGSLPSSHRVMQALLNSVSTRLRDYDEAQEALATEAFEAFRSEEVPSDMQDRLDQLASGVHIGGGGHRIKLERQFKALQARYDGLLERWAQDTRGDDALAQRVVDHSKAVARMRNHIDQAVECALNRGDSRIPEHTEWAAGGERTRVTFAGADTGLNKVYEAEDGAVVRAQRASVVDRGTHALFPRQGQDLESEHTEQQQPLGAGAGIRGNQARTAADAMVANRMWEHYGEPGAQPFAQTVADGVNQLSDAEVNAAQGRGERLAAAAQAAQSRAAEAKHNVQVDELVVNLDAPDHPLRRVLQSTPLLDRSTGIFLVEEQFRQEVARACQKQPSLHLAGMPPAQAQSIAQSLVARFNDISRFDKPRAPLEAGAHSTLWVAQDPLAQRTVVLKQATPSGVAALVNEHRLLSRFSRVPGIARSLAYFEHDHTLVLKHYPRGSADRQETLEPLTVDHRRRALLRLHQALNTLHGQHVTHGAVSLKRLQVDQNGEMVLADFSSAQVHEGASAQTAEAASVHTDRQAFLKTAFNLLARRADDPAIPESLEERLALLKDLDEASRLAVAECFDPIANVDERYAAAAAVLTHLQPA